MSDLLIDVASCTSGLDAFDVLSGRLIELSKSLVERMADIDKKISEMTFEELKRAEQSYANVMNEGSMDDGEFNPYTKEIENRINPPSKNVAKKEFKGSIEDAYWETQLTQEEIDRNKAIVEANAKQYALNRPIDKLNAIDGTFSYRVPSDSGHKLAGKLLKDGKLTTTADGKKAIHFEGDTWTINVLVSGKPELEEVVNDFEKNKALREKGIERIKSNPELLSRYLELSEIISNSFWSEDSKKAAIDALSEADKMLRNQNY